MTPEELDAIEARLPIYGYPPPWVVEPWHDDPEEHVLRGWIVNAADATETYGTVLMAPDYGEHLALWAASAREDIPALIAALREITAERDQLRQALAR